MRLSIERRLGDVVRRRLPGWFGEFVMFGFKQAWACLFGGLLLAMLIVTSLVWKDAWPLARYDFLFAFALVVQALFLALKLESWDEARVIFLFHVVGTAMEVFKIQVGSWDYPEPGLVRIAGVPLFSGFMYASVGSYMARVIRIFDMRFAPFPPWWTTALLAVAIYLNFFAHHYLPDIRLGLFAATVILFARTRIWFTISDRPLWMPLPVAAFLSALFLWLAENIGTLTGTWVYGGEGGAHFAGIGKLGSWYLLLYVSFMLVTLVVRDALHGAPLDKPGRPARTPSPQVAVQEDPT